MWATKFHAQTKQQEKLQFCIFQDQMTPWKKIQRVRWQHLLESYANKEIQLLVTIWIRIFFVFAKTFNSSRAIFFFIDAAESIAIMARNANFR